jgi:predicted secreted hydrolase
VKKRKILQGAGVTSAAMLVLAGAAARPQWRHASPTYPWDFPRDHWSHPGYRTEWWYFTGHLAAVDDPDRRFGFQFTVFRVGLFPEAPALDSQWTATDLVMTHIAVTDLARGEHLFSETLYRATPFLGGFGAYDDTVLAWSRAPAGTDGEWRLERRPGGFAVSARDDRQQLALALTLTTDRPVVFQGPGGYSLKSGDGEAASQYFSYTRLDVTGHVVVGRVSDSPTSTGNPPAADGALAVTGTAWMDREFSTSQLRPHQSGWDWFSLQLDDGRDLMFYRLRDRTGGVDFALGTLIEADGTVRHLEADDFVAQPERVWRSDTTAAPYPVDWTLRLPGEGLRLEVRALVDDQENVSRHSGIYYWEGAVAVSGRQEAEAGTATVGGRGYVELTGYGEGSRPPI